MKMKQIKLALSCLFAVSCASTSLQAGWADKVTIGGYGNINATSGTIGATGVSQDYDSFSIDDVDLIFNFKPTSKLRIAMDVGFDDGPATDKGRGSINLSYFFMEYVKSDALKFRGGKMFTSFGIYNEIKAAKVGFLTIDRPHVTTSMSMTAGGANFFPTEAVGLMMLGNLDVMDGLNYNLMISNGSNPMATGDKNNPFESDRDPSKAITAKSVLSVNDSWDVGASLHYEEYVMHIGDTDTSTLSRTLFSYGFQAEGEITDNLALELELIGGTYQDTPTGTTIANQAINRLVYTIMPSYSLSDFDLLEDVTLYLRYAYADADLDNRAISMYKGEVISYHLGFNYEIFSQGTARTVFKLEYRYADADASTMYAQRAGDISKSLQFQYVTAQIAASF